MLFRNKISKEEVTVMGEIVNEIRNTVEIHYVDSNNTAYVLYVNKFLSKFEQI